jgi:hypothetical protein
LFFDFFQCLIILQFMLIYLLSRDERVFNLHNSIAESYTKNDKKLLDTEYMALVVVLLSIIVRKYYDKK